MDTVEPGLPGRLPYVHGNSPRSRVTDRGAARRG
jgi:hypothetical protein